MFRLWLSFAVISLVPILDGVIYGTKKDVYLGILAAVLLSVSFGLLALISPYL